MIYYKNKLKITLWIATIVFVFIMMPVQVFASNTYGIGSISKVLTATCAMKLVEEGKLDLDEPIVTYIPEFSMADNRYEKITMRMLLNHSAGFKGMTSNNAILFGEVNTYVHDNLLQFLKTQTLKHEPGERSIYCNDGFTMAELVIEHITGMSFSEYFEKNFSTPMGLNFLKSPENNKNLDLLAPIYYNNYQLKPEAVNLIGSGGYYSNIEDLLRFSTIFMKDTNTSILSKTSIDEMIKDQHMGSMVDINQDSSIRYGLGFDSIESYPFSQYGIKSISKGGGTFGYHTNLTIIPELNLSAAVFSSGLSAHEEIIAKEIIMEVLKEEGIINETKNFPTFESNKVVPIPEDLKKYEGIYVLGYDHIVTVSFHNNVLTLTPQGEANKNIQKYNYTKDGTFVSTDNQYIDLYRGMVTSENGNYGSTSLSFQTNVSNKKQYILSSTYENLASLGQTAMALPIAQKLDENIIPENTKNKWAKRTNKNYFLVSDLPSSANYLSAPIVRIMMDDSISGYIKTDEYITTGKTVGCLKIVDDFSAIPVRDMPTMSGRDTNNIKYKEINNKNYLLINEYRYLSEDNIDNTSIINDSVTLENETKWFYIDKENAKEKWSITVSENASYFIYNDKMECTASSIEAEERNTIILPQSGYILFTGEKGAEVTILK